MPDLDLDDELARLRDELRSSLPVPSFRHVRERAKQRVVRRRMQVGAAAAVLAVSVAIPLLRAGVQPDPVRPATPPAPTPEEPTMPSGPHLVDIAFADAAHGYAIRATCATGSPCSEELLATDDGEHWRNSPLRRPKEAATWGVGTLRTLGPEEIVLDWPMSGDGESARVVRLHSIDGGRSWRTVPVPSVVTDTVAAIPAGASLVSACAKVVGGGEKCGERGFAVLLPGSAASARLANQPPLTAMAAGDVQTADGWWWVVGRDPTTNNWGLAVSHDDGRSWTTTVLDWRETVDQSGWSVVSANGTFYASAIGPAPNASNSLVSVLRSTDSGRTWQRTWKPGADKGPGRVYQDPVAGTDGTLTVNEITNDKVTYSSDDGGRTFSEVPRSHPDFAFWSRIGYISATVSSRGTVEISADGVHWRTMKIA
jgi:hypothetical protein